MHPSIPPTPPTSALAAVIHPASLRSALALIILPLAACAAKPKPAPPPPPAPAPTSSAPDNIIGGFKFDRDAHGNKKGAHPISAAEARRLAHSKDPKERASVMLVRRNQ